MSKPATQLLGAQLGRTTELDTCGCCDNEIPEPTLSNPPGQDTLDYRISAYSSFLERMAARLARERPPGSSAGQDGPLAALTTRAGDDFAMALLDAWAVVSDVLTFYQERIANEGFLRTAAERLSVLELARAIGYELNPGVAAETYLAFTVDESDSTPDSAEIPAGTQVQSIPQAQGERPQTFETGENFTAYAAWNTLRPRLSRPQEISSGTTTIYLNGLASQLEAGSRLLFVKGTASSVLRVAKVTLDSDNNRTAVVLDSGAGLAGTLVHSDEAAGVSGAVQVYALREKAAVFGHNAPHFDTVVFGEGATNPYHDWDAGSGLSIWKTSLKSDSDDTTPDYYSDADCYLERQISGLKTGSYVVLMRPNGNYAVRSIREVKDVSLAGFALSSKASGLELDKLSGSALGDDTTDKPEAYRVRTTTVYLKSEELAPAEKPVDDTLYDKDQPAGQRILSLTLDQAVEGLSDKQMIALSGTDLEGQKRKEIVELKDITTSGDGLTVLHFESGLAYSYQRDTVTINANVVKATHGETVSQEVLGGGDGSTANQQFILGKPPLTHVSAATTSGAESTLTIRVNDVEWQQASSLYGLDGKSKRYTVRLDDEANARVIFGDGKSGARLPTGQENVKATYRSGIGLDGEVGAGTLSLLKTRPFGVRGVTNPVDADGAEDPENLDDARENAPLTVLTLDRVVSLRDYEDFARAFAGIGKAQAVAVWNGQQELVHITIADSNGDEIDETSSVYTNLRDAIDDARDPLREVQLASFELITFDLAAKVLKDDAYQWEEVQADIETALLEAFAFEKRAFGQPATAAEIVAIMHGIEGVTAVDVDTLATSGATTFSSVLAAGVAVYDRDSGEISPAQLLLINESGISLTEMTL